MAFKCTLTVSLCKPNATILPSGEIAAGLVRMALQRLDSARTGLCRRSPSEVTILSSGKNAIILARTEPERPSSLSRRASTMPRARRYSRAGVPEPRYLTVQPCKPNATRESSKVTEREWPSSLRTAAPVLCCRASRRPQLSVRRESTRHRASAASVPCRCPRA